MNSNLVTAALAYAEGRWPILPLYGIFNGVCECPRRTDCGSPGKHPRTLNGLKDATTERDQINKWFKIWPNSNIGVVTGSASGIIVVDVDINKGAVRDSFLFDGLTKDVFDTAYQKTGGGLHYLYQMPDADVRNSTGLLAKHVDIRANGGYVVVAPSKHISGVTYEFHHNRIPRAFPRQWLDKLLIGKAAQSAKPIGDLIPSGSRNSKLTSLAGTMRNRGMTQEEVSAALSVVNERCDPPLSDSEVRSIAKSVSRYETGRMGGIIEAFASDPRPLPVFRVEAKSLAKAALPDAFANWVFDIAERKQCPPDFPACAAVVAASVLIGNAIAMRPKVKDEWLVIPNLWGAVVGTPGSMKSPAISEAFKPLRDIAAAERESFEFEMAAYKVQKAAADAKRKGLSTQMMRGKIDDDAFESSFRDNDIPVPQEKRVYTSDATIEKLTELLRDNPRGLLLNRDELMGFIRGLDKMGRESARQFFLEAWSGDGDFSYDTVSRGSLHVPKLTLSLFGSIQPSVLGPYLRAASETDGGDGFVQRLQLLVYPATGGSFTYIDRRPVDNAEVKAVFQRLHDMTPDSVNARTLGDQAFLAFDDESQKFFETWLTDLEVNTIRGGGIDDPALLAHLAKYRSLMPSLALVFHLIDYGAGPVGIRPTKQAADWCLYLESHARKLYGERGTAFDAARLLLKRIEKGELENPFSLRDVYRRCWSGLGNADMLRDALAILCEHGYLLRRETETGGRPTTTYEAHPTILAGGSR